MKKLSTLLLTLVLGTSGGAAMAGGGHAPQLGECTTQLNAIYGEQAGLTLIGVERSSRGGQLKINTMPDDSRSFLVYCGVGQDGELQLVQRYGKALAVMPYDRGDQVSMAD